MTESRIVIGDGRDENSGDWRSTPGSSPLRRKSLADASGDITDQRSKRRRVQEEQVVATVSQLHCDQDELQVGEAELREGDDKSKHTETFTINIKRIEELFNRMAKKWTLKSGKVVEDTLMQMLQENPESDTLAPYFNIFPEDPLWRDYFDSDELNEILRSVTPIKLRTDDLPEDERFAKEILEKTGDSINQRLDLSLLRQRHDEFKSNFAKKVHRNLLEWMDISLANLVWFCGQIKASRAPSESWYKHYIWCPTIDRVPIAGASFDRYVVIHSHSGFTD